MNNRSKIQERIKRIPHLFTYFKLILIITCIIFIIAAGNEFATLQSISTPAFTKAYCSHNFPNDNQQCHLVLKTLTLRYIYDAVRFALAPVFILILVWIYKTKIETKRK